MLSAGCLPTHAERPTDGREARAGIDRHQGTVIAPVFERPRDQPEDCTPLERVADARLVHAAHDFHHAVVGDGTELGWNLRLSFCGHFGTLGCRTSNVRYRPPATVVPSPVPSPQTSDHAAAISSLPAPRIPTG